MAVAHRGLGQPSQALAVSERALAACRQAGDSYLEAHALTELGTCLMLTGRTASARAAWGGALAIFNKISQVEAEVVRGLLASHPDPEKRRVI
jgi:Flp pilus assembly protein TadD